MPMFLFLAICGLILSEYIQLISDRSSFLKSLWGRSVCDSCGKEISWYALIPLAGRFLVGTKCPHCGKKISWNYFWFELIFSLGWISTLAFLVQHQIPLVGLLAALLVYSLSALLAYEDAKHFSVPLSWLSTWVVGTLLFWYVLHGITTLHFIDALEMTVVVGLSLVFVYFMKHKAVALSDMFGIADIVVLEIAALLLGLFTVALILLGATLCALIYLVVKKKLSVGQKLPLLTFILPWLFLGMVLMV